MNANKKELSPCQHQLQEPSPLLKRLDVETGRFYHVITATGESVWDMPPHELKVPLEELNEETRTRVKNVANELATERKKRSDERQSIISFEVNKFKRERDWDNVKKTTEEKGRIDNFWKTACERGRDSGCVRLSWQELVFHCAYGRDLMGLRRIH